MASPRVILDINVLTSRLLLPASTAACAVRRVLDRVAPLVAEDTLAELALTLSKPKFDRYVGIEARHKFFELFARAAEWVTVTSTIPAIPKDNKSLELAVDGDATLLVTGDNDLLALTSFGNTAIMTPASVMALTDSFLA